VWRHLFHVGLRSVTSLASEADDDRLAGIRGHLEGVTETNDLSSTVRGRFIMYEEQQQQLPKG
jgi:hypothetical protein